MIEMDLNDIFREAFGYEAPARNFDIELAKDRKQVSKLGMPYYGTDLQGREFFLPIRINGMLVPFGVIGMGWKKNIKSTPLKNRPGSVHELICIEDYVINIKGLLVNAENFFPENDMQAMFDLFSINRSITIRSVLTDIILSGKSNIDNSSDPNGYRVVIKEIKWPELKGVENVRPFEMDIESDFTFELFKKTI